MNKKIFYIDNEYPGVVYTPDGHDGQKLPLCMFWHGAGEMAATDSGYPVNRLVNSSNHANLLAAAQKHGFIVVAPLLVQSLNGWVPGWTNEYQHRYVEWVLENLHVDTSRVITTGLSAGGGGTWVAITGPHSSLYTAAIPICGTPQYECDFSKVAENDVAVWAWHGEMDTGATSWTHTGHHIAAIRNHGASNVQFTLIPGAGHNIWESVYSNEEIYTWALSFKKNTAPPPPPPIEKKVVARLFVNDMEVVVYDDKTAEVK